MIIRINLSVSELCANNYMLLNTILLWLPMIPVAFLNAGLRERVLVKSYGEKTANKLSTITLIILCSIYSWLIFPGLGVKDMTQALLAGLIWMSLTMIFEFSIGLLSKKTWKEMLADYDILKGRLWPLFLLFLLLLPYTCLRFR